MASLDFLQKQLDDQKLRYEKSLRDLTEAGKQYGAPSPIKPSMHPPQISFSDLDVALVKEFQETEKGKELYKVYVDAMTEFMEHKKNPALKKSMELNESLSLKVNKIEETLQKLLAMQTNKEAKIST